MKLIELGGHDRMTVEEALAYATRQNLTDVMILGYDAEGDLAIISSHMVRGESLFLIKLAEAFVLSPGIKAIMEDE